MHWAWYAGALGTFCIARRVACVCLSAYLGSPYHILYTFSLFHIGSTTSTRSRQKKKIEGINGHSVKMYLIFFIVSHRSRIHVEHANPLPFEEVIVRAKKGEPNHHTMRQMPNAHYDRVILSNRLYYMNEYNEICTNFHLLMFWVHPKPIECWMLIFNVVCILQQWRNNIRCYWKNKVFFHEIPVVPINKFVIRSIYLCWSNQKCWHENRPSTEQTHRKAKNIGKSIASIVEIDTVHRIASAKCHLDNTFHFPPKEHTTTQQTKTLSGYEKSAFPSVQSMWWKYFISISV